MVIRMTNAKPRLMRLPMVNWKRDGFMNMELGDFAVSGLFPGADGVGCGVGLNEGLRV